MSELSKQQLEQLKQRVHALKPVILLGNKGLTPAVHKEITTALKAHELIKIRLSADDRDAREAMIAEICESQQAQLIQKIGAVASIYKKNDEKKPGKMPFLHDCTVR